MAGRTVVAAKFTATILLVVVYNGSCNVFAMPKEPASSAQASLAALECLHASDPGEGDNYAAEAGGGCNLSAPNCGTKTTDYIYPLPEHSKNCKESAANHDCPSCILWTLYAESDRACASHKPPEYCNRERFVTIVKDIAPKFPEAYLALPNEAVTGIELWKTLPSGEKYWGNVWDAAEFVITSSKVPKKVSWTLDTVGIALNPSANRTMHQMHFHMDRLKSPYRSILDSTKPPGGFTAWPPNRWVSIEAGKAAMFVGTSSKTPETVSPFASWDAEYARLVPKSNAIHLVGLLVTKDKANRGWFLVVVQGPADSMLEG